MSEITPPAYVTEIAKAALKHDLASHTDATVKAAHKLANGEPHTKSDLLALVKIGETYGLHPTRAALGGSVAGRNWAMAELGLIQAAAEPQQATFTELSDKLAKVDDRLMAALQTALNMAVERALVRMGHKVKASAKRVITNRDSDIIKAAFSADVRTIKHHLPISVKAMLTLDEETEVRQLLTEDLRAEVLRLFEEANTEALDAIAADLNITVEQLRQALATRFEERTEAAFTLINTVVGTTVLSRLNNADEAETDEDGNLLAATVAFGVVRDAVSVLGGAASTPAGGVQRDADGVLLDPSGKQLRSEGFANSTQHLEAVETVYENEGQPIQLRTKYTWLHNSAPDRSRPNHAEIDGVSWFTKEERRNKIGNRRPGGTGCQCVIVTELVPVELPPIAEAA